MNTLASPQKTETGELRLDEDGDGGDAFQFYLNLGSPLSLWLRAREQTIGFRSDDLKHAHWKKVWRLMSVD